MVTGDFIYFPLEDLQSLKTQYMACLAAIAAGHQTYSIAGRQVSRANLGQVSATLREINYAIAFQTGTLPNRQVLSDFSCGPE